MEEYSFEKREYALQLPNNYVDVDREEMEYVDGGARMSQALCISTIVGIGLRVKTFAASAAAIITSATKLVSNIAKIYGGFYGWLAGAALAYAGRQVVELAKAVAYGALRTSGVDITWSWNLAGDFGVNFGA